MQLVLTWCLILVIGGARTESFSAEDLHRLPQLYDLDNYERCLSRRDGIYCLGTFELTPRVQPHPVYELMKERTKLFYALNRTLIHRGYCISLRCKTPYHGNTTHRFEQCASLQANEEGFNARLQTGQCITHEQHKIEADRPVNFYEKLFLYVICLIVIMNVVGTVYDVKSGDVEKNNYLTAWSIRVNWSKIFETKEENWTFAVNGLRVIVLIIMMYAHSSCIMYMIYSYNGEDIENVSKGWVSIFIRNSTSAVLKFIIMSCFLTATYLLKASTRSPVTAGLVMKILLKKVLRILPVMLLVTGFSATWWPHTGDGPLWASTVRMESQLCRENFWFYAFFLNNLLEVKQQCLPQTWGMSADIQYTILSLFLTVLFLKTRVRATTWLSILFVLSCALNVILAYIFAWNPISKLTAPENLRTRFETTREMSHLHMSPWGNLPGCILGLLCAHVVFERQKSVKKDDGDDKTKEVKDKKGAINFVKHNIFTILLIVIIAWALLNKLIYAVEDRLIMAIFVGLERLVFTLIFAVGLIQIYYLDGYERQFLSWRGWVPLSRLSFSVIMIHWCINLAIAAQRPLQLTTFSAIVQDWIVTVVTSYILAVPVSLMVEYPIVNISNLMLKLSGRLPTV